MAKSNYEFKKLKAKSMPAKIVESTAVRVLGKAAQKLSSGWKKFISIPSAIVDSVKAEAVNARLDDMTRITTKMEENQNLVNTIRQDGQANSNDFNVMGKAQAENEKLAEKLEKLMNKKVSVETKTGESVDLNAILTQELGFGEEVKPSTFDELNKAFDEAGIVAAADQTPVVSTPVVEPVVQPTVEPALTPMNEMPNQAKTEENLNIDPVVSQVINTLNDAKKAIEQNQLLNKENEVLKQTNSTQAVSIANLSKENETLKESVKNQNTLEQKISDYASAISRHEIERSEMSKEVEKLKYSSRENEVQLKNLESDMAKISKERDFYKSQILALKNAIGFNGPTIDQATVEENKVR